MQNDKTPAFGLLVEDHADASLWLSGVLKTAFPAIRLTLVEDVATALATIEQLQTLDLTPDLALIDLHLPDGSGVEVIARLRQTMPGCICIVASRYDDDDHLLPALRAGAQGYLLKQQAQGELVALLAGIVDGKPPLSPAVAQHLLASFHDPKPQLDVAPDESHLTVREQEVLERIAQGHTLVDVADQLQIKHSTVASHVRSIYTKLQVRSRAEATLEAVRRGLVAP